ncbi:MAG: hypothetical protein K8T25_17135 [Planctomycetia bacterium]|nr:hypothetical protein [Planctomycetia bacterium]
MVFWNLIGLLGVVLAGVLASFPVIVAHVIGHGFSDATDLICLTIGFGLFSSLFAFTFDRCDEQGLIRSYFVLMKSSLYETAWRRSGVAWADPRNSGFAFHPQRRLCYFGCPLVLNVYILVLGSVLAWCWRAGTNDLTTTHAQHLTHLLISLAAAIVATIYGLATKKRRLIPPLAASRTIS